MVIIFIGFLLLVLSFNFYMMSYQINGINRLVLSAPMSLFESAIVLYEINLDNGPIFDREILEENITSYFSYNMTIYVDDYDLNFYYYRIEDHSLDMGSENKAVEVSIKANIVANFLYQRTMYYEIWSN